MEGYGTATAFSGNTARALSATEVQRDCLPGHIDELARVISHLEEEVSALAQTLTPIAKSSPQGNSGKEAGVPTPIRSSLSNQTVDQIQRLTRIGRAVRELRESIDL